MIKKISFILILIAASHAQVSQAEDYLKEIYLRFIPGVDNSFLYGRGEFLNDKYGRSNWTWLYLAKDSNTRSRERCPSNKLLMAGEPSAWLKVELHPPHVRGYYWKASLRLTCKTNGEKRGFKGILEIASKPDKTKIIRSIKLNRDRSTVNIIIYSDKKLVLTADEISEKRLKFVEGLKLKGVKPKKFIFQTNLNIDAGNYGHSFYNTNLRILSLLGFNAIDRIEGESWTLADKMGLGKPAVINRFIIHDVLPYLCANDGLCAPSVPENNKIRRMLSRSAKSILKVKNAANRIYCINMGDEIGGVTVKDIFSSPGYSVAFRKWLKKIGFDPASLVDVEKITFGKNSKRYTEKEKLELLWSRMNLIEKPILDPIVISLPSSIDNLGEDVQRRLYYYTRMFRRNTTSDILKFTNSLAHEYYPPFVRTTINFNDARSIFGGMMFGKHAVDWIHTFKTQSLDCAMGETGMRQEGEMIPYMVDLMRCATKYHKQPIAMYIMVVYGGGNSATISSKVSSCVSRGVKYLKFAYYGPWEVGQTCSFSEASWPYRVIAQTSRDVSAAEEHLYDSKLKKQAALLYSRSEEIWGNLTSLEDRRYLYYGLLHSQIPVDLITEEDVVSGELDDYKILYLTDTHILKKSASGIRDWVKGGGVLWLDAGAGSRDEFDYKINIFDKILGIRSRKRRSAIVQKIMPITVSKCLPQKVYKLSGFGKEKLYVKNGSITAKYKDGTPAIIIRDFGKGKIIYIAGKVGLSYHARSKASKKLPHLRIYPDDERGLIQSAVKLAGVVKPVELNSPQVEAVFGTVGDKGAVISLINYNPGPVNDLIIKVNYPGAITSLKSVKKGKLKYKKEGDSIVFKLSLGRTDYIVLNYKE